jgi:hypothetical protein
MTKREFEMPSEVDFAAVPRLPRVPESQREFRNDAERGLRDLILYVRRLQAALSLFDFALSQQASLPTLPPYDPRRTVDRLSEIDAYKPIDRQRPMFFQWRLIAAHDGIFSVDHFIQTIEVHSLVSGMRACVAE